MSDFGKLLRGSRFASLAKPLAKNRNNKYPTHQVVETRAAALARQEWGLKYALPSKIKSRYITFNDFDSLERMVDFEPNGGDHWKRLRFQEIGVVPKYENDGTNPLFTKDGNGLKTTSSLRNESIESLLKVEPNSSKKEIQSLEKSLEKLRPEFRQWLLKNNPELLSVSASGNKNLHQDRIKIAAVEFLKEHENTRSVKQLSSLQKKQNAYKINGFGGLSYGLKGRLTNNPNGYIQEKIVPARYLNQERTATTTVAVGGFVASAPKHLTSSQFKYVSKDKVAREVVVPMYATGATMNADGIVNINVSPISLANVSQGRYDYAADNKRRERDHNAKVVETFKNSK